jgi:hypothetical protein
MLDFTPLRKGEMKIAEFVKGVSFEDLAVLTNAMIDRVFELIEGCQDEDVVFVPSDPDAHDPFAEDERDVDLAWTLGHVIVHITASSEESAALAAELARGVEYHGRSRSELFWKEIKTMDQCHQRLEESRRMRLASLKMWPDKPHLDNTYESSPQFGEVNAISRFIFGLKHADDHLEQIEEIVRQAKAARAEK